MTNKQKKTLNKMAEAVINNDLKMAKKIVLDLDSTSNMLGIKNLNKLSDTNQFGEPYYLIAKRLGYDELSEYLYQHTSENLINKEYLTSPVQVLYNLVHVAKNHEAAVHKALEEYALNPLLAKLLIPIALENFNKASISIVDMDPKWKSAFNTHRPRTSIFRQLSTII